MKKILAGLLLTILFGSANAHHDLVKMPSNYDVETTTQRLIGALKGKGLTVFNEIDHAKGAKSVDLDLPPTRLVIFGNPKVGTKLMHCDRSVALDLPMKALIWEDDAGQVWLTYHNVKFYSDRYNLDECKAVIGNIEKALQGLAAAATFGD